MKKIIATAITILAVFSAPPDIIYALPVAGSIWCQMECLSDAQRTPPLMQIIPKDFGSDVDEHIKKVLNKKAWHFSQNEELLLKQTVQAECGYQQPDEGVRMVVDVILNRIKSKDFPNSVGGVVSEPYHFSTYWNGMIANQTRISKQVDNIVEQELKNNSSYPALLYFTAGCYNDNCIPWRKVGDHYFGY